MYKDGELFDTDIYADLGEILSGEKPGREHGEEFIYFNAVGLSFVDVALAGWLYERAANLGIGTSFEFGGLESCTESVMSVLEHL